MQSEKERRREKERHVESETHTNRGRLKERHARRGMHGGAHTEGHAWRGMHGGEAGEGQGIKPKQCTGSSSGQSRRRTHTGPIGPSLIFP